MRFKNEKEAEKKALRILKHWRSKELAVFQFKGSKLEVLLEFDMFDTDKEERISRSRYFVKFENYPIGDYAVFRFVYRKR